MNFAVFTETKPRLIHLVACKTVEELKNQEKEPLLTVKKRVLSTTSKQRTSTGQTKHTQIPEKHANIIKQMHKTKPRSKTPKNKGFKANNKNPIKVIENVRSKTQRGSLSPIGNLKSQTQTTQINFEIIYPTGYLETGRGQINRSNTLGCL